MSIKSNKIVIMKNELINLPIGAIGATLGSVSLANAFGFLGVDFLKHIFMNFGLLIIISGFLKLILHPEKVNKELKIPALASIYPTLAMTIMVIGNYFLKYNYIVGKSMWLLGIILHIIIMLYFVCNNILNNFKFDNILPSWFVPFVGILVSNVVSTGMNSPRLIKAIFYFGCISYFILLPLIIYRLIKTPVLDKFSPTITILVAPPSLCIVSYLTVFKNPNLYLTLFLLSLVLIMTLFVYCKFPKFFTLNFSPVFASLTFPLAVSCIALFRTSQYIAKLNYENYALILKGVAIFQLFVASAVTLFVIYNFLKLLFKTLNKYVIVDSLSEAA